MGQLLSLPMVAAGAWLVIRAVRRGRASQDADAPGDAEDGGAGVDVTR